MNSIEEEMAELVSQEVPRGQLQEYEYVVNFVDEAEFSPSERVFKAVLGPALMFVWWYFAPDYSRFISMPLGQLTLDGIGAHLFWLMLLLLCIYRTISWLYEAFTGHDSVWLWHS